MSVRVSDANVGFIFNGDAVRALCRFNGGIGIAGADILPWLNDPFATEKKASDLVAADLKPGSCLGAPDLKRKLHFQEIVVAALCGNPDTKAAYLSLLAQAASYGGSYAPYFPSVTATGSRERATTFYPASSGGGIVSGIDKAYGISTSLTLYDFGQREFKLEIAELTLIAAGHSYNSALQGMIATAMNGYFQLLTAQNAVDVSQEAEHYAKESYDAAQLRHHIGQVPLADELQAKGAYSQATLATQQAENQLSQNKASLAVLMRLSTDAPVQVAELDDGSLARDPFDGKVEALMAKARETRADLLASRAQLRGSEESLRALKRADLATISATANMGLSGSDIYLNRRSSATRAQGIGLSVSIPIFTGFSQTYNEQAARRELEAQRESLNKTELTVEQDVWNSWHNYQTAKQSWDTSQDLLASSLQLKDVALGRYKEGLGTILDLLNAESQYSAALQSHLQSRYSLLTTRIDLVRSVGVLDLNTMRPQTTQKE